jgi:iron-sulfur cluster repair protein YtfE (RIC family)
MEKKFWLGVAGGVIASRLLPPLFAQMRGAAGSIAGEDPFKRLIEEHRMLLAMLDRMEGVPSGQPGKRLFKLLAFKRLIAKHAMAEEDVVYPLLHEKAGRQEAADKLYREHGSLKVHIFMLQQSVHNDVAWRQHVRALREEITSHARQEEEEEFPRVRALREATESTELSRNLRQEEALIL